jgi:hypothetical protein
MPLASITREGSMDHDARSAINSNFSTLEARIATLDGLGSSAISVTATEDGADAGTIPDRGAVLQYITVTSGNDAHIVTLPSPVVGTIIVLYVPLGHGYILKTSDPTNIAVNQVSGATAKGDVSEDSLLLVFCVSSTEWKALQFLGASGGNVNGVSFSAP